MTEVEELQEIIAGFQHVRETQDKAHQEEMQESVIHCRMEAAINAAAELQHLLGIATNGFYQIIMHAGKETRQWHGWTVEKQMDVIVETARTYEDRLKKAGAYRRPGRLIEDIRGESKHDHRGNGR